MLTLYVTGKYCTILHFVRRLILPNSSVLSYICGGAAI